MMNQSIIRPNVRRPHSLDDWERAMTDDGKTVAQETRDSVCMLGALIIGASGVFAVSLLVIVLWVFR